MNGVGWLLEKLDLIPDGIDKARQQADKAQRELEASAAALAGHQLPWVRRRYPNQSVAVSRRSLPAFRAT
jgi:hypothetical protein